LKSVSSYFSKRGISASYFLVLPLPTYAATKAHLHRNVQMIEEFDMLIGSSAVHHGYVMVTENLDHFERIPGIEIENWVERPKKK